MKTLERSLTSLIFAWIAMHSGLADPLPGTAVLDPHPDFSAEMVRGVDAFAMRLVDASKSTRKPDRALLKAILGVVDNRLPAGPIEWVGGMAHPALLHEDAQCEIFRVRWPVLDGVYGEGLYLRPKGPVRCRMICLPDADTPPEDFLVRWPRWEGCEMVFMTLISRGSEWSTNDRFGVRTNVSHREWIYRQAFELGRHVIGYELQKILALLDWSVTQSNRVPVFVAGVGEGGRLALYAAAVDDRIAGAYVGGAYGPREVMWSEPLDRNVFGALRDFGDAEVASLVAPRRLVVHHAGFPVVPPFPVQQAGLRMIAAPGVLKAPSSTESLVEVERAWKLVGGDWLSMESEEQAVEKALASLSAEFRVDPLPALASNKALPVEETRQKRQVRELERFTQQLLVSTEIERNEGFWKRLPLQSMPDYERITSEERDRFWREIIGRLPDPNVPMNARSRLVRETAQVAIYEIMLDVWDGVFAWGWLCLPKNLAAGERRPVVVCQHGLEGLPEHTVDENQKEGAWRAYKAFSLRLAEEGFITFAPHNPYRGKDAFRVLQRKLNPLGFTLFSVINGQHQRILEWLKAQPFTQPERIAFYGLSYGGKTAMRTPAVLTDYCLSICSGDFNEWVRKCVSTDMPMNYTHTHEYEMWEWNLGRTFNYAEMAALIAPRPFMVERGHSDGVGSDEWVNYEYAKVRRLYNRMGIGDRTVIEHFDGPHTIHGVGTYEFLRARLGWKPEWKTTISR